MVSASPWSVKGVEPEARAAAKSAARHADMTLGQWLNRTIRQTAAEQLAGADRSAHEGAPFQQSQNEEIDNPEQRGVASAPGASAPAPGNEAIFESIRRLSRRIEESESRTEATVVRLANRVDRLSEQIEHVKVQAARSTAPVERAILRLSERLERIEPPKESADGTRGWLLFGRSG